VQIQITYTELRQLLEHLSGYPLDISWERDDVVEVALSLGLLKGFGLAFNILGEVLSGQFYLYISKGNVLAARCVSGPIKKAAIMRLAAGVQKKIPYVSVYDDEIHVDLNPIPQITHMMSRLTLYRIEMKETHMEFSIKINTNTEL